MRDRHVALVVDDDPDIALVCTLQLERAGFDVVEAGDGRQAVDLARSRRPSVILLDHMLPDFDGVEVMRRLRDHPETRDIPVVMLTARTHERDQRAAWKAGVHDYLTKPFDGHALVRAVRGAAGLEAEDGATQPRRPTLPAPRRGQSGAPSDSAWLVGVIEGATDAIICTTLDGEITYWNRGAEQLYGWHAEEVLGRHVSLLTSVETLDEIPEILTRVRRGEAVRMFETVRLHRDGHRLHVFLCVSPILDEDGAVVGASAIARDISARVSAERRHEQLLEQAPDAIVVIDAEGDIELVNRQTEVLFGYDRDQLIGRPVETLLPGRFREVHPRYRQEYAEAPRLRAMGPGLDLRGLRSDGTELPVEISLSPLQSEGSVGYAATVRDVTESKQAAAQLRALLEAAPDAIIAADASGLITLVNRRTEEMFGYSRDYLVGRRADVLMTESALAAAPRLRRAARGEVAGGDGQAGVPQELLLRRRDHTVFPAEVGLSTYATDQGEMTVASVRDVSERRRADERFRAVVEAAPDAMVIVAADGTMELVNAQMVRLFGYEREEMIGRKVEMLVPQRFRRRHVEHRSGFHDQASVRPMGAGLELAGVRKDGGEFAIEISLSPLDEGAGTTLTCATIRDVTERRIVERAKELAAEREREASARLREVDRMRSDFLSTVSHELRTPLTAIKGFSEWLTGSWDQTPDERKRDVLRRIHHAGGRLDLLIQDLLDVSRLERSHLMVDVEPSSLRVLVDEAVQHTVGALDTHPVVRRVDPVLVLADRTTFLRVLENLLTNATKFSEPGTPIEISSDVSEDHVVLAVRDHGAGIPEAEHDRIFERFYRVASTAQTTSGTGIGLAIVKQFVEAQGGTVSVHSPEGGGAEFRLRLRRSAG